MNFFLYFTANKIVFLEMSCLLTSQHGLPSKKLSTPITSKVFDYLVSLHGWLQRPENIAAKRKHRKHVLVCAPSNSALDEIVLRLLNTGCPSFLALLLQFLMALLAWGRRFIPSKPSEACNWETLAAMIIFTKAGLIRSSGWEWTNIHT